MAHLNSVIFHTQKLAELRRFYTEILGLQIASTDATDAPFVKGLQLVTESNAQQVAASSQNQGDQDALDESEMHVNFDLGGTLLCFEVEDDRLTTGTLILNVEDLSRIKDQLRSLGVPLSTETAHFLLLEDPEGREIILEQN